MTTINKLLLIGIVLLSGCSKENSTEPANSLAGNYNSSSFILPDAADRSVDVQASGGSVNITFTNKNEYTAKVIIPQSVSTIMGSGITKTYTGSYVISNDTVKLSQSGFIINSMKWHESGKSVEALSPARGGLSFVLQKQ
jgi:hypothetical protein